MLEFINQETNEVHGNDCLIQNCYTIMKCHEMFMVMNIRRYSGWCDNGMDMRGYREFDNIVDATNYYNGDLRNM